VETPAKHPDYVDLSQAFSLTDKIKEQVAEKMSQAKNKDLMLETKRRATVKDVRIPCLHHHFL